MTIPPTGRIIAIDWGEVRLGLALSDETQFLATPLTALVRRPGKRFPMPPFLALIQQHRPVGVVVGLPLTLAGGDSPNTTAARKLAALVEARTTLPTELVDERLTTVHAHQVILEQGGSTWGRREEVDALAAALLLQGFLDQRRGGVS